jgi:hypothetical protein
VKSCRMTLAGLKGISKSCSELVCQLRMVSMSVSNREGVNRNHVFTLHIVLITVPDGTLQQHSDGEGQGLHSLVVKSRQGVVVEVVAFDVDIFFAVFEWVSFFH